MEKKKHKYYYTYKIILLKGSLAGKYYYGQHSTDDIRDHYAGSGKILQKYYKKYRAVEGVTYIKEILKFYNGPEELNKAENVLIGDLWKTDPECLNQCAGGGSSTFQKRNTKETKKKLSKIMKGRESAFKGKHFSEESKKKLSIGRTGYKNWIAKSIVAYNYKNKQIFIYDCIANFVRDFPEYFSTSISACCRGKYRFYKNFQFKYLNEYKIDGSFPEKSDFLKNRPKLNND